MDQPTQTRHPWRATLRTVAAGAVSGAVVLPLVADQLHLSNVPAVAAVVAGCGALTRVLAMPAVDAWLLRFAPWLAAQPPQGPTQ